MSQGPGAEVSVSAARWWVALAVPPLVWGARLLAGWAIAEVACDAGWEATTGFVVLQTVVTAVALGLVITSGIVAYRAAPGGLRRLGFDPDSSRPFLVLSGILSVVVFGLLVLVEGSAVYMVSC